MKCIMRLCGRVVSSAGLESMKIKNCCHCTLHSIIFIFHNTGIEAYCCIIIVIITSSLKCNRSQRDYYAGY